LFCGDKGEVMIIRGSGYCSCYPYHASIHERQNAHDEKFNGAGLRPLLKLKVSRFSPMLVDSGASGRVYRGGGFSFAAWFCRSAYRFGGSPDNRYGNLGFRPVITIDLSYWL